MSKSAFVSILRIVSNEVSCLEWKCGSFLPLHNLFGGPSFRLWQCPHCSVMLAKVQSSRRLLSILLVFSET